ncbi:DNA cytosine methyltransferase [Ralstonia pseudosolanacearum]
MPTVVDLFAGAGGLSLGAARAGFTVRGSVELDPFAIEVHRHNFPGTVHLAKDVARLTGPQLLELCGLRPGQLDGLIGGPPCQGFSAIGKRDVDDSRNDLFGHFFRLVSSTRPAFFVAENVPGILDSRYAHIISAAFARLRGRYRLLEPITVQANKYGAPTTRTRVFFIGYRSECFTQELSESDFLPADGQLIVPVSHALRGLPIQVDPAWQSAEAGWRPIGPIEHDWFYDRVTNAIPVGLGDPISIERYVEKSQVSGCMGTFHTAAVAERFRNTPQGAMDSISKAPRLHPERFCPTLRAGTSKERGSYQSVRPIHHIEPRVITPREAARLQGFPDWFVFHETKWHSFRQIGNSVSPIVADHILTKICDRLR